MPSGLNISVEFDLGNPVLVLNRLWQPLQTCSVRRALSLLCLDHAKVVQTEGEAKYMTHDLASWAEYSRLAGHGDPVVHSPSVTLRVPSIIVLESYDQMPKREVKFSRENVFERDSHTCQYCRKKMPARELNLDHVIPRDKGGRTTWTNIVTSCIRCNTRKANKLPREANMFPMNSPTRPNWRPLYGVGENQAVSHAWSDFISPAKQGISMSA